MDMKNTNMSSIHFQFIETKHGQWVNYILIFKWNIAKFFFTSKNSQIIIQIICVCIFNWMHVNYVLLDLLGTLGRSNSTFHYFRTWEHGAKKSSPIIEVLWIGIIFRIITSAGRSEGNIPRTTKMMHKIVIFSGM